MLLGPLFLLVLDLLKMLQVLLITLVEVFVLLVLDNLAFHLPLKFNLHHLLLVRFHVPLQLLLDLLELLVLLRDYPPQPLLLFLPLLLRLLLGLHVPVETLLFSLHLLENFSLEVRD